MALLCKSSLVVTINTIRIAVLKNFHCNFVVSAVPKAMPFPAETTLSFLRGLIYQLYRYLGNSPLGWYSQMIDQVHIIRTAVLMTIHCIFVVKGLFQKLWHSPLARHSAWYIFYRYLGNNPLGCYCQLIDQVNTIKTAVMSGECQYPSATAGITLGISTETTTTYYANAANNASLYQCSK